MTRSNTEARRWLNKFVSYVVKSPALYWKRLAGPFITKLLDHFHSRGRVGAGGKGREMEYWRGPRYTKSCFLATTWVFGTNAQVPTQWWECWVPASGWKPCGGVPQSSLRVARWCTGAGGRSVYVQSIGGNAVCRGRWACAVAAASRPQGRCLRPLGRPCRDFRCRAPPRRHSGSSPGSLRRGEGPVSGWSAYSDSSRQRTCFPGLRRLRGRWRSPPQLPGHSSRVSQTLRQSVHTCSDRWYLMKNSNLLSFNYVKLHCFAISNTAKIFPGVVLFDCSLKNTKRDLSDLKI